MSDVMNELKATLAALNPKKEFAIYDLVDAADISVEPWKLKKDGTKVEEPRLNTYQNMKWVFGGEGEPMAFTVWHKDLSIDQVQQQIVLDGNIRKYIKKLRKKQASDQTSPREKQRLETKLRRAQDFDEGLQKAFFLGEPVRAIIVGGQSTRASEEASASSDVKGRELDPQAWYVHVYEPGSGRFLMVRAAAPQRAGTMEEALHEREESDLSETERVALSKLRVGQQLFRNGLLSRWEERCSVTGCDEPAVLIASHTVPWRLCESKDRLLAANGLLLTPNLDRLFDQGLISFDEEFRILLSPALKESTRAALGVSHDMRLRKRFEDMRPYLARHRQEIFITA